MTYLGYWSAIGLASALYLSWEGDLPWPTAFTAVVGLVLGPFMGWFALALFLAKRT
jgi:hypothetical protein